MTTKIEVLHYIQIKTQSFDINDLSDFSALNTSKELSISRSLASQYLNELQKNEDVLKISSRPVLFIHKETLERMFNVILSSNEYLSVDELERELNQKKGLDNFYGIIGANGSLKSIIDQCKASISYPPHGLPILLLGATGTGKKTLSRAIFEYSVESKIISKKGSFCVMRIHEDSNSTFKDCLFEDNGFIEQSRLGVLYIEGIHLLDNDNQQILEEVLSNRVYEYNGHIINISSRFILASEEDAEYKISRDLLFNIPLIAKVQSYNTRFNEEKESFIIKFFIDESVKIGKDIYITDNILRLILNQQIDGEVIGLKKLIRFICASANADNDSNELRIYHYHLPKTIVVKESSELSSSFDGNDFKNVKEYHSSDDVDTIIDFYDEILSITESFNNIGYPDDIKNIESKMFATVRMYYDYLLFAKKYDQMRLKSLEHSIAEIIRKISMHYSMNVPVNSIVVLSRVVYILKDNNSILNNWRIVNGRSISLSLNKLGNHYPKEMDLVSVIEHNILNYTGTHLDDMSKLILLFDLKKYTEGITKTKYMGIILAHGYSTASSIANTVNSLTQRYVFDAIDMPLDTTVDEIVDRLEVHVNRNSVSSDLIVLVDMGSLEDIGKKLDTGVKRDIGVVNNVSTQLALDVAYNILSGKPMQEVLDYAVNGTETRYKIIQNKANNQIIVFTSENGIGMANRMVNLFTTSLPRAIDVEIISMEYDEMRRLGNIDKINNREVLFVTGTSNPGVSLDKFISLEDMIDSKGVNIAFSSLENYLTKEEINGFSKNFAANFSLQNVVSHLTILEPIRLMEFVREFVDELQLRLNNFVSNRTIIGLYIHISCMIERLVTKDPIYARENLEQFRIENKEFIKAVEVSFDQISSHYGISIPDSEVSYLYDYIKTDKEKGDFEDWRL